MRARPLSMTHYHMTGDFLSHAETPDYPYREELNLSVDLPDIDIW